MTTAIENVTDGAKKALKKAGDGSAKKPLGLAIAGAALAAAPLAAEKLAQKGGPKVSQKASDLTAGVKEKAKEKAEEVGKDAMPSPKEMMSGGSSPIKKLFGGDGGGESDDENGGGEGRAAPGHGSGRRMPIQQSVDVAVPVERAYNIWTEFEEWPQFMHRIESAEQVDEATVSFQAKIWGINKRFEADIVEQRPDKRIEWNVTQGYAHTGVVTFHPIADSLTRVDLSLDVQPANIIDKASRGMRFVKRAVRGDLHRFKAYAELDKDEADGWRGTIEEGEVTTSA
jgi:uncharacterized membrane protein